MSELHDMFVNDFTIKCSYYLLAAASTATALSWNETFKSYITTKLSKLKNPDSINIIYSIAITLILILLIRILPDVSAEKTTASAETNAAAGKV